MSTTSRFTEADRARFAEQRQVELDAMHQRLSEGVSRLVDGHEWQAWLQVAAKFSTYSFRNSMLIYLQDPEATAVAGYKAWQTSFGRQVNKGEKGIRIFAPILARTQATDRDGHPILDADGRPKRQSSIIGVKPTSVFDVRQTTGPDLPEQPRPQLLKGQAPPGVWDNLAAFIESRGYTVQRGDCGQANGITRFADKTITLRPDIDDVAALKTLFHEAGHMLLHAPSDEQALWSPVSCRGVAEVEAESVAFLALSAHHVDSSQYTFAYVAGWAEQAVTGDSTIQEVITQTGVRVVGAARTILDATRPEPVLDVTSQLTTQVKTQITADRQHRHTNTQPALEASARSMRAAFPAPAARAASTPASARRRAAQPLVSTRRPSSVER